MWTYLQKYLRCPQCAEELRLAVFRSTSASLQVGQTERLTQLGIDVEAAREYIDEGVLLCDGCGRCFPVTSGVPVLLTYPTAEHEAFAERFSGELSKQAGDYDFPQLEPVPGEEFVLRSFSKEWGDYDYDGVIWEMDYQDHERRFLAELGGIDPSGVRSFLEVGCGIGITTGMAEKELACEAVGVDLSTAAMQAARHFRDNPLLHFVQASVFHLPFRQSMFDVVYTRGVLHHTYSTEKALVQVAKLCNDNGLVYLWVYGPGSINETRLRRVAFAAESILRPVLSRRPDALLANIVLAPLAFPYVAYNRWRRRSDPSIQPLTFSRAIHAARDRFTPRYAHRHAPEEVLGWFREIGFADLQVVDWRTMPSADYDDYRRNVGVRARRKLSAEVVAG